MVAGEDQFDWTSFLRLAGDFELLLAEAPTMPLAVFEQLAHAILSRVYASGSMMPSLALIVAETGGEVAWRDRDVRCNPAHDEWMAAWRSNYDRLGAYLGARDLYFMVPDSASAGCVTSTLSDDLADILADLKAGATLFDESRLSEAMWEWRSRFDHWGEHALLALGVLHRRIDWDEA